MAQREDLTFSVLVSLLDSRGVLQGALEGWCTRQRYDRALYEVVAAGQVDADEHDVVLRCLRNGDRHIAADAMNASTQWRAAADAAKGRWLIFVEAHSVPAPDFLQNIERRIRETVADVLGVASPGTRRGKLEWLDQNFMDGELEQLRGVEDVVLPRGFAVRRSTYDAVGGIMPGVGSFAVLLLGKKLLQHGVRFDRAPQATLVHYNASTIEQPRFCVADYINGEYDWRASVPEVQAWEMFGAPPIWSCRGDTVPRHARAAARALVLRALAAPVARDSGRRLMEAARGLPALLPTMFIGARSLIWKADAVARETENRLRQAGRDAAGIKTYREHWRALATAAAWHRAGRSIGPPAVPELGGHVVVDSQHLFGLSPPECVGDRWLRRIRGVAGMQLPAGLAADAIDIRVEPMPGPGDLLTFWKGKLIGVVPAGASTARITIPHTSKNAGQDHSMLVLIDDAHPFPRWGAERSDPPGKRKRADIAWMDVVAHSAEGSRAFTISPRGHAR